MSKQDKLLENLINSEIKRQQEVLSLIPSENYVSPEILSVVGSPLMNKYSEGYPGRRYYPGNEYYDQIELLAQERALQVFRLKANDWSVNVQPYSGSPANAAIYTALMNFKDTLMGMKLAAGGHLTHGHFVSFSGKAYRAIQYGVNEKTGLIEYDRLVALAKQHKPKVIVSGTTAYPRELDFKKFGDIAKSVGAYHVADVSHIAGLIASGFHLSPFPYADAVMMTTHKTLRGPRGAVIFTNRKSTVAKKLGIDLPEAINKAVFPGLQGGPHNNITAAKALMFFEALQPEFKRYQQQIIKNSKALSKALIKLKFNLVTNGTDNHLLLVDLRNTDLDGMAAEKLLEQSSVLANRNSIPGDTKPFKPSGLRLGTPAATTRGMKEPEMELIAKYIYECLVKKKNMAGSFRALCKRFPLRYGSVKL